MPVPVLSVESMRAWESDTWATGTTEAEVIDRVGQAIAEWIERSISSESPLILLAGKGHNGDDARAAMTYLKKRHATLINVLDPITASSELEIHLKSTRPILVDALFGIGLNRDLSDEWCQLIERMNQSNAAILSIDVPSGLSAQTGEPMGASVRADWTLTVGAPKAGMLQPSASHSVGYIRPLTRVGLGPVPKGNELFFSTPSDFTDFPPRRTALDHKGSHGHLWLIAGSPGFHGAAVLAARTAMRARPGLISLTTMPECYVPVASQLQQVMVHSWEEGNGGPDRTTAIVTGPGLANPNYMTSLSEWTRRSWLEAPLPMVVDASALAWLPQETPPDNVTRVITPHPGEAARLLNCSVSDIERDRPAAVRSLSQSFGNCWVVLKGTHTLIGTHEGPIFVNASGSPGLAQGGSGDVLAGLIGGLLAQPSCQHDISRMLRYAAWIHGTAAERLDICQRQWTIEDLPNAIGELAAAS